MKINNVKQLNIEQFIEKYYAAEETESKNLSSSFKVTPGQGNALKYIAKAKGLKKSELQRAAVDLLLSYVDHVDTLMEEQDFIMLILEKISSAK